MMQPDLFAPKRARNRDPWTSKLAALSVQFSAEKLMGVILKDLEANGEAGFSRIAHRTGLRDSQVWKRLSDLQRMGLVEPTGRVEKGDSGRQQTIWRAIQP